MSAEVEPLAIAHVIQAAVAPVFVLSGTGMMINVLTNRLARIVDRARVMEARPDHPDPAVEAQIKADVATLSRRARLVNRALTMTTICSLLVCLVIVALFAGAALGVDLSPLIGSGFVAAMLAFVGALVVFLREIFVATAALRIGRR